MSSSSSSSDLVDSILSSANPSKNSYECFGLPIKLYEPAVIRRTFYKLSLKVHPDKNSLPQSKEAFQKLSTAFEILYDLTNQKQHLQQILIDEASAATNKQAEKREDEKEGRYEGNTTTSSRPKKKRKANYDWKEEKKKKKQQAPVWAERHWEDIIKELRRREELERAFIKAKSDERLERRIKGMIWKAMKVCRALDERAGCPPTFVNGLWAPLYEQEVFRTHKVLPEGWEFRWDNSMEDQRPKRRIYRYVRTGEESFQHPIPDVERLLEKARNALEMNKFQFHTEPRLFLGEILEYLKDDHDYTDMDDDMIDLEEEEQAKLAAAAGGNNSNQQTKEYDY